MKPGAAIVLDPCFNANELAPALAQKYGVSVYASPMMTQLTSNGQKLLWLDGATGNEAIWYRFDPTK